VAREPRRTGQRRQTPVEAIRHGDKRTNIPTADAHDFVDPQTESVRQVRYARDESLDPQLVWRGNYDTAGGADDLVTDAPPIYIQEKIDPRVLVENLRRTAPTPAEEPELALFDTFDGLDELEIVDFYRHRANWSNRMVLGDSLQVMGSLAEREQLRGTVQMVYIDPPYGIRFGSNWQVSALRRDVKDGRMEDAAREAEQIKAFRDTWELGIHSYLSYLRDRLLAARELLTESGSCFVQIGDENVHLVRSLMDEVFGGDNFCSLIFFRTTSGAGSFAGGTNVLASTNDDVVWYARDLERVRFRQLYLAKGVGGAGGGQYTWVELPDGTRRRGNDAELREPGSGARVFRPAPFTSQTTRVGQTTVFPIDVDGATYRPAKGGWKTNRTGAERLADARRLLGIGNTLTYVRYLDDFPAFPISNFWADTVTSGFSDPKVYVVQTNTRVVERCMLMCTDPGDLVLDPTCGSGTTAYVAEQWGRRWITVDTSRVALALARQRVMGARYPYYLLADSPEGHSKEEQLTGEVVPRNHFAGDIRHGFVYERVQHITLKSIANNPDVTDGMSRDEVDAAISRHAEHELLYDKPYVDPRKVRVAGPFTVESLSPHRSPAFAGPAQDGTQRETISEREAATDADGPTFEQTIVDNLAKAGIQTGRRAERISFATLEPYAGSYIQAVGERLPGDGDGDAPARVAVAIGPQYGTVSPAYIKQAAEPRGPVALLPGGRRRRRQHRQRHRRRRHAGAGPRPRRARGGDLQPPVRGAVSRPAGGGRSSRRPPASSGAMRLAARRESSRIAPLEGGSAAGSAGHRVPRAGEVAVAGDVLEHELEPPRQQRSAGAESDRRDVHPHLVQEAGVGELTHEVAATDDPHVATGGGLDHLLVRDGDVVPDEADVRGGHHRPLAVAEHPARHVVRPARLRPAPVGLVLEDPLIVAASVDVGHPATVATSTFSSRRSPSSTPSPRRPRPP